MNNNPIEELRRMSSPVSESEWDAIVHDQRYVQKFGRKPKFSPKGRAALIAGAAAMLITIPILFKTLSNKPSEAAQTVAPATTETTAPTPATTTPTTPQITQTTTPQTSAQTTHKQTVNTVNRAATHEGSTFAVVTEARTISPEPTITRTQTIAVPTPQSSVNTNTVRPTATPTVSKTKTETSTPSQTDADLDETPKSDPETEELALEADEFYIPSAFTPNGDGLNDLFLVKANFEPRNFEMTIINRSGERLFQTRDMNIGWDGRLHGNILPSGMYVYIIKYKDSKGKEQQKQGQILLIP
jgi:gliding motility-associated-like protein